MVLSTLSNTRPNWLTRNEVAALQGFYESGDLGSATIIGRGDRREIDQQQTVSLPGCPRQRRVCNDFGKILANIIVRYILF